MKSIMDLVNEWVVKPGEDCCTFANYIVQARTGRSYLPQYEDEDEMISKYGGLEEAATAFLGPPVRDLKTGDVCLVRVLDNESLGIILDNEHAVCLFNDGLPRYISRAFVDLGWSV